MGSAVVSNAVNQRSTVATARSSSTLAHCSFGFQAASATHVGMVRPHNEDALTVDADRGLFILCDGMGGYNAGEVASAIAIGTILTQVKMATAMPEFDPVEVLADSIELANKTIIETGGRRPECLGMGSTAVATVATHDKLWYAHVGDSRLYLWRKGELRQLTHDHSVGQEMHDAGALSAEETRRFAGRGVLTRALGIERDVRPDVAACAPQHHDLFLLCSDGLSDMVNDARINEILSLGARKSPSVIASALQAEALKNGGVDNVSLIVARCVRQ